MAVLLGVQNSDSTVSLHFLGLVSAPMPLGVACIAAAASGGVSAWACSTLVLQLSSRWLPPAESFDNEAEDPDYDEDDYDEDEDDGEDIIEVRYVNRE
jgi:hypothetical protein